MYFFINIYHFSIYYQVTTLFQVKWNKFLMIRLVGEKNKWQIWWMKIRKIIKNKWEKSKNIYDRFK